MNQTAIFWPVIAQVLLVYIVYGLLGLGRKAAVQAGDARVSDFRENRKEPPQSLFVNNNLANQFQLPVLFYVVCLCLYVTQGSSIVTVALAWIFVVSRYLHAFIHVTSNRIRYRSPVFALGYLVLGIMWLWFALHLLSVV
jgi:hypothetical protein